MTDRIEDQQELPVVPIMPTGSGIADLEMVRELDAIVDDDPAGDDVAEADRLKE